MNDQTEATQNENAVTLIEGVNLPALYAQGEVMSVIKRIEDQVRNFVPDLSTAKSRKAITSLAFQVTRSKTALDDAGKMMNEDAQKKIDAVNAERKAVRERLDALRDEVKKPLLDWEAADEKRKDAIKTRLLAMASNRTDWMMESSAIADIIAEVEAIDLEAGWDEFVQLATDAKADSLIKFKADLIAAKGREDQAAELAKLREEKAAREKADAEAAQERLRVEVEKRAEANRLAAKEREEATRIERMRSLTEGLVSYINTVANEGTIGGMSQPFGILIYELESKIDVSGLSDDQKARVEEARLAGIRYLNSEMAAAEARREADQKRIAEEGERRAKEAAEARAAKIKADEDRAAEKRAANTRHREKITKEIQAVVSTIKPDDLVQAMIAGKIPHVTVSF